MDNIKSKRTWGSHIPINKALMETYDITGILELGAGYHSTKMFFDSVEHVLSVETDPAWVDEIKEIVPESENHNIVRYEIDPSITRASRAWDVGEDFLEESVKFFKSQHKILKKSSKVNLLFVDCISSLRRAALDEMYTDFDFVVFHDYNLRGRNNHWRGTFRPNSKYKMFVDATYPQHTGIIMKNKYAKKIDELSERFDENVFKYTSTNDKPMLMKAEDYGDM